MTCTVCGATIADKAIVCYRCGAPTAAPAPVRPQPATRRRPWAAVLVLIVFIVAILTALVALARPEPGIRTFGLTAAAVLALVAVAVAWRSRRGSRRRS